MNAHSKHAAAVLVLALLLGACASEPTIHASADPAANFASYKTFSFFYPLETDKNPYSTTLTAHLKSATRRELENRGYQYVASDPQLLVNFNAIMIRRADLRGARGVGGFYGYRAGMYGAWPGYPQEIQAVRYKEGTLGIDLVDAKKRQLVWQGLAEARITKEMSGNPRAAIDKAVAEMFEKYPIGGAAAPTNDSAR